MYKEHEHWTSVYLPIFPLNRLIRHIESLFSAGKIAFSDSNIDELFNLVKCFLLTLT